MEIETNNIIVGAGDWTAAALINNLFKHKVVFGICDLLESDLETALKEAQKVGAESCSYEGARGMMQQRDTKGWRHKWNNSKNQIAKCHIKQPSFGYQSVKKWKQH